MTQKGKSMIGLRNERRSKETIKKEIEMMKETKRNKSMSARAPSFNTPT